MTPKILVIDDEKNIRKTLGFVLESEGYDVVSCATATDGLACLEKEDIDLVILDIKLPGMSGMEALARIRSSEATTGDLPVLMISGHATLSDAVRAVREGATDFFEKPLDRDEILIRVANCLKQRKLTQRVRQLQAEVIATHDMLGKSEGIQKLMAQVRKVAPTRSRVLITGESGTGKEIIARSLHECSSRREAPFVKVNCAAIPGELIESELFGYEKGAFTGAGGRKIGHFETADTGTLFLDEIGDMTLSAQAKVLRVLQSGELIRVGGQKPVEVDVRVLAATNKDLESAIETGRFREDLYFRLNVVPLHAPPLRERLDDVPLLLEAFIQRFCDENGYPRKSVDSETLRYLCSYSWPGNVRELKNLSERLVILSGEVIQVSDLPETLRGHRPRPSEVVTGEERLSLKQYRDAAERQYILETLEETGWNISKAADYLGIERTNLHKKLRLLGISRREEH